MVVVVVGVCVWGGGGVKVIGSVCIANEVSKVIGV